DGKKDNPGFGIHGHARPNIRPVRRLPRVLRPSVVAILARLGNRVEDPTQLARSHVVGAYMTGRGAGRAHDDEVAVNGPRSDVADRDAIGVAPEPLAKVDATIVAEALDRLPIASVDCQQVPPEGEEDALLVSRAPVADAAQTLPRFDGTPFRRIVLPKQLAGRRVERNQPALRRNDEHAARNHEWVRLHVGLRPTLTECI